MSTFVGYLAPNYPYRRTAVILFNTKLGEGDKRFILFPMIFVQK